jgi:hypothetical protein
MTTPNPLFGVFRLDSVQRPVNNALLVGPQSSLFEHVPSSISREHLADTAAGLQQFVAESQQRADQLRKYAEQLATTRADLRQFIDDVCESLSGLQAERDAEAQRAKAEQQRKDAEQASREELNSALGALPAESLGPDLRSQDPGDGEYPDADTAQMPDHPAELLQERPEIAGA